MLERQRDGIARAKADGKYKGRKPTARAKAADVRALKGHDLEPAGDLGRPDAFGRRQRTSRASIHRILSAA
jgi:DNA invertase Pin-like site-specific DNA recombinase